MSAPSGKITYAQSSDIKARTPRQYRMDMNKKAIAELEFLPVLQKILAQKHGSPALQVQKNGGDREEWFRTDGKISREPDYLAKWGGKSMLYEFQYAETTDRLDFFDFKVSKVRVKKRGEITPHTDRQFFYVAKPGAKVAFITPKWIMTHGKEGAVPAWGSRPAYRVARDKFLKILKPGGVVVSDAIKVIDDKNLLLSFVYEFYDIEAEKLSRRLQDVVDHNKIMKIMPRTLQGMYESCYLLESIGRYPDNAGAWLVYLCSFFREDMSVQDMANLMFSLDFLTTARGELEDNEQRAQLDLCEKMSRRIKAFKVGANGLFSHDPAQSPLDETRQILFCANMLENLNQRKVKKLFQTIPKISAIAGALQEERDRRDKRRSQGVDREPD